MPEKYSKLYIILVIISMLIIISLIISFFYYLFYKPSKGECEIIIESPGEDKVEIVFLTNNVPRKEIDNYIDYFLKLSPFNKNKDKLNFYYAGESDCEIIENKAVYCYSRGLIRKSSVCPNDFIVVLSDVNEQIRSSAYLNVISLNANNPTSAFPHEFAHVFANLADEYVPAPVPFGSKNCVDDCNKFSRYGELEGCFSGCGKTDYERSSEDSLMRTLKHEDFGRLNELLILKNLDYYE